MDRKLQSLEMLRAVAALLVVLYHTGTIFGTRTGTLPFAGIFASGFRGVDLFFVLSGFIIAHVHARDIGCARRLGNYLFNRAARIYPAVWIMTAFAGGLYAIGFGGAEKAGKLTVAGVVASALLLPQVGDALVNVSWTLKYELFFYVVFAVLILDLRGGLAVLAIWQLATLLASIGLPPGALGCGGFYLRSLCLDFGVGLACAWLVCNSGFVTGMRTLTRQWGLLAVGIMTFVGGMMAETHTHSAGIPCALGAGAIIVGLNTIGAIGPHPGAAHSVAAWRRILRNLSGAFLCDHSAGCGADPDPFCPDGSRSVPGGSRLRCCRRRRIRPAGGSTDSAPASTAIKAGATRRGAARTRAVAKSRRCERSSRGWGRVGRTAITRPYRMV
jgi:peptidoglycan/LPS O-acetylase OafA/YrhL